MDYLITRSAVFEAIENSGLLDTISQPEATLLEKTIKNIKTPYNVDKVKKYFKDKINAVKQTTYINDYLQNLGMQTVIVTIIDDLLRIVEKGDVDDDIDIPFW